MLRFEDVWLSGQRGPVFRDLCFQVSAGECIAFTAGGTSARDTVLSLCLGESRPTSGRVWTVGREPATLSSAGRRELRRRVGLARADVPLVADWSLERNFRLALRLRGVTRARTQREGRRVAKRLGIVGGAYRPSGDLTEEVRMLGEVARATLGPPPLVLIGLPLDILGQGERDTARKLVAEAAAHGAAVVLARVQLPAQWGARPVPLNPAAVAHS